METLVNMDFEYVLVNTVDQDKGVENIQWMIVSLMSIYNYHFMLGIDENPEESEKMLEVRINRIPDLEERASALLGFVKDSVNLRKYCVNPVIQCAHSILRIFLKILSRKDAGYDRLLEISGFGYSFASLAQKQYSLLQMYIRTKTENIHVISLSLSFLKFSTSVTSRNQTSGSGYSSRF